MKRLALVLPLLLPIALLAGCGGSSGLSKADYVSKAEALCKKANADVKALPFPQSTAGISDYAAKIVSIADQTTKDLVALEAPDADKADLQKKVLEPLQQQVEDGKEYAAKIKAAVESKDQKQLTELVGKPPTSTEADLDFMRSYGFKECVESAKTDG